MGQAPPGAKQAESISVDQLIALNDEIAALVRSGFPIERGLMDAGTDLPGRLGRITQALGSRMATGESLQEALAAERRSIPPLYGAVVQAGVRAGRLPAALEGLAGYTKSYAEARRTIGLSLIYPLLVASFSYALLLGFLWIVLPRFIAALDELDLTIALPVRWLEAVGEFGTYWWPIGPVVLVVIGIGWYRSGRAADFQTGGWSIVRFFPWSRGMLADFEAANFADLMALLIDQQVPIAEALELAGHASGDPRMILETTEIGESLRRGESVSSTLARRNSAVTPLLRWVLAGPYQQGSLAKTLRNLATSYRKRASHRAETLQVILPIILLLGVGAVATLIYGLVLIMPLLNLLDGLSLQ